MKLETSYSYRPVPQDGVYTIPTALSIRTHSPELQDWQKHQQTHGMMQDFMCLVYGKPCLSQLIGVMREDDQDQPPEDDRRQWREAYQPSFGRGAGSESRLSDKDEPLFYLDETDADCVSAWLSEYSLWKQPLAIAASTLFSRNLTVEHKLLQVAVALEKLGYIIGRNAGRFHENSKPQYQATLKEVFASLNGYDPIAVINKNRNRDSWRRAFNDAYNQIKHAGKNLSTPYEAWRLSGEGMVLIRCWLAIMLGVPTDLITERLR